MDARLITHNEINILAKQDDFNSPNPLFDRSGEGERDYSSGRWARPAQLPSITEIRPHGPLEVNLTACSKRSMQ